MSRPSIYTESNNCQDCYKCVRECPVKAISIKDHKASVLHDLCIFCGHCISVCPVGAKKVREDLTYVKMLAHKKEELVLSLAPSFVCEFPDYNTEELFAAIKKLGFKDVYLTSDAAETVNAEINSHLNNKGNGVYISSCCPSVIQIINKYYPEFNNNILPFLTPMLAHGKWIRNKHHNARIIFAGPCISKKNEHELNPGYIDGVITFGKLKDWLKEESILPEQMEASTQKLQASEGLLYPIEGGMVKGLKKLNPDSNVCYMSFSGINRVKDALEGLHNWTPDKPLFLELLSCPGGCINGPGSTRKVTSFEKRSLVHTYYKEMANANFKAISLDIQQDLQTEPTVKLPKYSDDELRKALEHIYKHNAKDELNCGGCGYESCKEFVQAMLDGRAEDTMCVSYMRKLAHNKATLLLEKMPYGVVIVDDKLDILESNDSFTKIVGEEALKLKEFFPTLEGINLNRIFKGHEHFTNVLESGADCVEKDLRIDNKLLHLSIFTIQPKKMLCGIIQNLKTPEVRKEEIVKRTRKVIQENLKTVQQIASLLGENASQTESMLNTIVESFDRENHDDQF